MIYLHRRAGKATGNVTARDEIAFGAKEWFEGADGLLQPLFAGDGVDFRYESGTGLLEGLNF